MSTPSPVFDASAPSLKPLEIAIAGRIHCGRVLSIVEWFAFAERFDAEATRDAAATTAEAQKAVLAAHALMLEFLRAVFPPTRSWRTWFRPVDPVGVIAAHGLAAVTETFHKLFTHQAIAQGMVPRRLEPPPAPPVETPTPTATDGTGSPDKTAAAPSADGNASPTS